MHMCMHVYEYVTFTEALSCLWSCSGPPYYILHWMLQTFDDTKERNVWNSESGHSRARNFIWVPRSSWAWLCLLGVQRFDFLHIVVATEEYRGSLVDLGWDQIKSLQYQCINMSHHIKIHVLNKQFWALTMGQKCFLFYRNREAKILPVLCLWRTDLQPAPLGMTWGKLHTGHCQTKPIESGSGVLRVYMQLETGCNGCQMRVGVSLPELSIWALLVSRVQKYTSI